MMLDPLAGGMLGPLACGRAAVGGVPQTGLIYEWPMEESGTGDRIDTKAGLHLVPSNPAFFTRVAGKVGYCLNNSEGARSGLLQSAAVTWATSDMSVAQWVKPDTLGHFYTFYRAQNQNGGLNILWWAGKNRFSCYTRTATYPADWGAATPAGAWYFLAAGYTHALKSTWISVNAGARVRGTTDAGASAMLASAQAMVVGNAWPGPIDQVRVYDRELTDGDIAALYNGGNGI